MKYLRLICLAALVFCAAIILWKRRVDDEPEIFPAVPATDNAKKVATGYNEFGFKLLRAVSKKDKTDNVCLSPLSIAMTLAMANNGANGVTRSELDNLLGAKLKPEALNAANQNLKAALQGADPVVRLSMANSLWANEKAPLNPDFIAQAKEFFDAQAESTDLTSNSTQQRINDWCSKKTHGKIPTMLDAPLSPSIIMVLLNAVYFNGNWVEKFDATKTKEAPFHALKGEVQCPFMNQSDSYDYFENKTLQMVALPYGTKHAAQPFAMWLVLPRPNVSLDEVEAQLNAKTWQSWVDKAFSSKGTVKIPKMKLQGDEQLAATLANMGAPSAFKESAADFSRLTPIKPVWIDEVRHKAVVEVDEEGTVAAAVTVATFNSASAALDDGPPFTFVADRPFLLAIQERETGSILFLCRVMQPN